MKNTIENKFGSSIYERIDAVQMSATERQIAINAMRDADALVDTFIWFAHKIEQLGAYLMMKPSVKH